MIKRHASNIIYVLVAAFFLSAFSITKTVFHQNALPALQGEVPITIRAVPVPLSEADPEIRRTGAMRFIAGWALTGDQARFGGFSGLVLGPENKLTAISDRGDWLTASFDMDASTPLTDAHMRPFTVGETVTDKLSLDSESLTRFGDGFLVSFEFNHRFMDVAADGTVTPSRLDDHIDFTGVANNSGFETVTFTRDGAVLAFPERGVDVLGRLNGWLAREDSAEKIYLKPPKNFSPTDAATLKNGDVLILMRHYSPLDGLASKLVRLRAADIVPGATLEGEELMHLEPPFTLDNFEGLDVIERPGESPLVVMISDDNFRAAQRTLLMVFALELP